MFKKILGLILCVAMVVSVVAPVQAAKDTTWKQESLRQLGIYQENPVTFDGFVKSLAGFFYDNPDEAGSAEDFAKSIGILEAGEAYMGQNTLTVGNALKIAVIALGYKPILGADGNYIKKASELGIADGVSGTNSAKLKASVATDILYAMLDAEPLVKTFGGKQGVAYEVAYDKTLLSINRDIEKVKGLLTGTETTSIYGNDGRASENYIIIDDVSYYIAEANYDRFLGKNVIAYVQESEVWDNVALSVSENEKSNPTIVIDCEDIEEIGDSISYITYQETKTKTKKLNIVASPRVLYNGKFLEDYVADDFRHGMLELIDYNNDKKYDVIKITSYETIIVEAIDSREKIINNRYTFGTPTLKLNAQENPDVTFRIFDSLGVLVDFAAIKVNDVLSVSKSRDGKLIDIYISGNDNITGTITGINNTEDTIYIDREEYEKSEDFMKFLANTGKKVALGDVYIFYIDYFGKIAFIKEKKTNDYNVLIKIGYDYDKDIYYAVHMDLDGDWYTTPISKKVTVDGAKADSYESGMELLKTNIKANPEVVMLRYNSKNEILNIDTTTVTSDSSFRSVSGSYYYRDNRYFQKGTSATDLIYPENDAKVIVVPQDNREDKESWEIYNIGSFFKVNNYNAYTIKYFNPDKFNFTDLFLVSEAGVPADSGMSRSLYVVTGFRQILVDGDPYPVIEGTVDGFMNLSFLGNEANIFDGIEIGDVINFNLDNEGKVKKVEKKHSLINFQNKQASLYGDTVLNAGTVESIDYEEGKMLVNCGGDVATPFRVSPTMQVTVYYGVEGCESKALNNVNIGDKVIIRTSWGRVDEIVCAKN